VQQLRAGSGCARRRIQSPAQRRPEPLKIEGLSQNLIHAQLTVLRLVFLGQVGGENDDAARIPEDPQRLYQRKAAQPGIL